MLGHFLSNLKHNSVVQYLSTSRVSLVEFLHYFYYTDFLAELLGCIPFFAGRSNLFLS